VSRRFKVMVECPNTHEIRGDQRTSLGFVVVRVVVADDASIARETAIAQVQEMWRQRARKQGDAESLVNLGVLEMSEIQSSEVEVASTGFIFFDARPSSRT